ncbi:MAG: KpsF/GutQ family sugar-phosphate isomerase [Gammaproteobacteria bacterium]|nr:KpsF/GutQ family sugar-phosphate isomerase [Gammaproteobacteria bacterium]
MSLTDSFDPEHVLALAREVLTIEARAIDALTLRLGEPLVEACRLCLASRGRLVVLGMGKSGHIGGKIAATLASTGSPAFFVNAGEASHGDLGMITGEDVVLMISNSGETPEIIAILPMIKRMGVPTIGLTGKADSTLARIATVNLDISVSQEACPLNLAPTASTTATLAMGDALAVALLASRGFTQEDFARSHPGGTLGRRLLLTVGELMHTGDAVPHVGPEASASAGLLEMTRRGLGMTAVVDDQHRLLGIFTDGDLRRALDRRIDVHDARMGELMTRGCRTIGAEALAAAAVELMQSHKINALLVVDDEQRLIGALNVHDLMRAGVM